MKRGFNIVSGGTDNHLFLIDLIDKKITGKAAESTLDAAHITVNKNAVPNDPLSPFVTSGLRLGTPAMTTRGMGLEESEKIAHWVCDVLENIDDTAILECVKKQVLELCQRFPVYALEI